jgi:hypothetical protein
VPSCKIRIAFTGCPWKILNESSTARRGRPRRFEYPEVAGISSNPALVLKKRQDTPRDEAALPSRARQNVGSGGLSTYVYWAVTRDRDNALRGSWDARDRLLGQSKHAFKQKWSCGQVN